jgi:hypothetical protein
MRVGEQSAVVWNSLYRGPAESAGLSKPHVVDQHDQHVRGARRRLHCELRRRRGVPDVEDGAVRVPGFRDRQHRTFRRQNNAHGRRVLGDDGHNRHRAEKRHQRDADDKDNCVSFHTLSSY